MSIIKLSKGGFTPIPEGNHIFKITGSTYDEDFGKLKVEMTTAEGAKHTERYSLLTDAGEINEGAQKAFSFMAKTALNNFNLEEIDNDDLIGCYIKAKVEHETVPSQKDPARNMTFIRLRDMKPASGFEAQKEPVTTKAPESSDEAHDGFNLDVLLG